MFVTVFIFCVITSGLFASSLPLEIKSWTLSNHNKSIVIRNVKSPVDVYSALYQDSLIDWPLKGFNDVAYRWIAYENWTFTSDKFPASLSNQTLLSLSGMDVYPIISLNNHLIRAKLSEFNSVDIPIDGRWLKSSDNILQLKFTSPPLLAKAISSKYKREIPPKCWPPIFHGECHVNMLRKTQSSFGWDWGPAIPTMGIRGDVKFHGTNKTLVLIKGVRFLTDTDHYCQQWFVVVVAKLRVLQVVTGSRVCVMMKIEALNIQLFQCILTNELSVYTVNFNFKVDSPRVKLWWPRDFGTPVAYKLDVIAYYHNLVMDSSINYVGFRSVELNQSFISGYKGRYFQFNVNCRPFFVKGTNLVPRTYLSADWNNESYVTFLLYSVADANINTIRIWGGGRPELKLFYTIADRLGIMIWHDLMFAGSMYPDDKDFLGQVSTEISDLLWETQIHPSILVWSGNNEIELLIASGWYNTKPMDPVNVASYEKLFCQLIKPLVASLDPFTPFVLSSPSNGIESEKLGGVSPNPQSLFVGDVHFYLYSGNLWDERSYPITRMTTEFGFQSYPSIDTWALITERESDFEPNGTLANHRQHLSNGFEICENAIMSFFGRTKPIGVSSAREKYSWFSYLSQINQAVILTTHINRLRTNQCSLTATGEGYNSGAMYWQLNDNWIAPSWSTIESNGQWKVAHYYVKTAFTNQRIILSIQDDSITVRVIFAEYQSEESYSVNLSCVDSSKPVSAAVTGETVIEVNRRNGSCGVVTVLTMPVGNLLRECRCTGTTRCIVEGTLLNGSKVLAKDRVLVAAPKDIHLPKEVSEDVIGYKITNDKLDPSVCVVILTSKFVHLFVTLTTISLGNFYTNGFHLWKNEFRVTFNPWYYHQEEFFNCSNLKLTVKSLNPVLF